MLVFLLTVAAALLALAVFHRNRASIRTTTIGWMVSLSRAKWLPAGLRYAAIAAAFRLSPIRGAAGMNGARVLLKINLSDSADDFEFLEGQTNLVFNDTTNKIDLSDKLSGRLGESEPGRATATVNVDVNILNKLATKPVQDFMKGEYRNRRLVEVMRFERDNLDAVEFDSVGSIVGTDIESCQGYILNCTETFPDQESSTYSLEIDLQNDWAPVV